MKDNLKRPSLFAALIPVVFLTGAITINVLVFKDEALLGSNQMILFFSAAIAAMVCLFYGIKWNQLLHGIVKSTSSAMPAILILLMIGALSGTWLISGVVPAMISYGLEIMHPSYFLVTTCIICSIVSVSTGSSWSTVATIGVALLGIGKTLGIPVSMIGGAIISGAYFGDKISPLSDTTNLASAVTHTDLFTHIKYMGLTTIPSYILTLIIFIFLGFHSKNISADTDIIMVQSSLEKIFHITPWLFIVPLLVIVLIILKIPALPAIFIGAVAGAIAALVFQPQVIQILYSGNDNIFNATYVVIMKSMFSETKINTGNELVSNLLSTGGMKGMLNTVWLIISAMTFGGIMEAGGLLRRITEGIISIAKNAASLVATTAGTCIFINLTASDQYLSIVIPGRMFADVYEKKGLKSQNLSRTLEDSGTVTSVLIPWNTCGATQSTVLGVPTIVFMPYCFFNIISPIMTIVFAVFKIKIAKIKQIKIE